jgi:hypothetical protein
MVLPTPSDITDAAVRAAAHNLTVERGMARVMAQQSGPGTAPPAPKSAPVVAIPTTPAAPALAAPPPKGWDARRPSSMAALDAARREREAKKGRS